MISFTPTYYTLKMILSWIIDGEDFGYSPEDLGHPGDSLMIQLPGDFSYSEIHYQDGDYETSMIHHNLFSYQMTESYYEGEGETYERDGNGLILIISPHLKDYKNDLHSLFRGFLII